MGFPLQLRSEFVLRLTCCLALAACGGGSDGTPSTPSGGAAGSGTPGAAGSISAAGSADAAGSPSTASGGASSGATGLGGSSAGDSTGSNQAGSAGADVGGSPGLGGSTASGGSGNSGNSGGLGGSSAGASAAAGAPSCGSAVFCDGFERAALGSDWTIDNAVPANTVELVTDKSHGGTSSVHMKFTTTLGATFIHETKGFPAPNNSLWGRVWLYVMTPTTSTGHDVYIEASDGMQTTNHGVRPLNTSAGTMEINIDPSTVGGSGETTAHTTKALPRGAWTCFEWQIAATANSGSVTLYMDGTQLANVPKVGIPNFVDMRVGYEHFTADAAGGDLWIDDYALGTSRLNCN